MREMSHYMQFEAHWIAIQACTVHSAHEQNDTFALIQQNNIQNKTREQQQLRTAEKNHHRVADL